MDLTDLLSLVFGADFPLILHLAIVRIIVRNS